MGGTDFLHLAVRLSGGATEAEWRSAVQQTRQCSGRQRAQQIVDGLAQVRSLRNLAAPFGLNHPDSVSNLIRRAEKQSVQSRQNRNLAARIVHTIAKTENRV